MPDSAWKSCVESSEINGMLQEIAASDTLKSLMDGTYVETLWAPFDPFIQDENADLNKAVENHIKSLQLLESPGSREPPMALYRLGLLEKEADVQSRIQAIFGRHHTFLLNTSGTGKTRLLYEGLCQNWGLYFTFAVDSTRLGVGDLSAVFGSDGDVFENKQFDHNIVVDSESASLANPGALERNLLLSHRHLSALLLARLLVFKVYSNAALPFVDRVSELKKVWLRLQLGLWLKPCTPIPFRRIYQKVLIHFPANDQLDEAISDTLSDIILSPGSPVPGRFFIVVDEANAALSMQSGFRKDFGDFAHYPQLKVLVRSWMRHLQPFRDHVSFVVAGTDIPRHLFADPAEWGEWKWSSNTGAFDTKAVQKRWVAPMLPPNVVGMEDGDLFLNRLWKWTRGRHRATAALISVLLDNRFSYLQSHIDAYILSTTGGYRPYDCNENNRPRYIEMPFDPLPFESLEDRLLACRIHQVLLSLLFKRRDYPCFSRSDVALVNNGFGRFIDPICTWITVDEPIVIAGAARWFTKPAHSLTDYTYFFRSVFEPTLLRSDHLLSFFALILAAVFDREEPWNFTDIFNLSCKSESLEALSLRLASSHAQVVDVPLRYSRQLSEDIVTWSLSTEDALTWFKEHATPFCIHSPPSSEPTLMFVLTSTLGERFWVFLRVLPPLYEYDDANEYAAAVLQTSHPDDLFKGETLGQVRAALQSLPGLPSTLGELGVLRVVASLGQADNLVTLAESPLIATLQTKAIEASTRTYTSDATTAAGIVDTIVKHAIEDWSDQPDPLNNKVYARA